MFLPTPTRHAGLVTASLLAAGLWACAPTASAPGAEEGAPPPVITTDALAKGIVGGAYSQPLTAVGGAPPLAWSLPSLPEALAWLRIDEGSGELRGLAPRRMAASAFVIRVVDAQRQQSERTYALEVEGCTGPADCHLESGTLCVVGEQACHDGALGACEARHASTSRSYCGQGCARCGDNADHCEQGQFCVCGATSACGEGQGCCASGTSWGCKSLRNDVAHCGKCNQACAPRANVAVRCAEGACQYDVCAEGWGRCGAAADAPDCPVPLDTIENCGACGVACPLTAHATAMRCSNKTCLVAECEAGWKDCDGVGSNGCETNLNDVNSCGGCYPSICPSLPNGYPTCAQQTCGKACRQGFNLCPGEQCLAVTDMNNCGGCGNVCAPAGRPHVTATSCAEGYCANAACERGWGECNRNPADGCETELGTRENCGACGKRCGSGFICAGDTCERCVTCRGTCCEAGESCTSNGCE